MIDIRQNSFRAKRAAAIALSVVLAAGLIPSVAFAQEASAEEIDMTVGSVYELPIELLNADDSGEESPAADFFEDTAQIIYDEDGTYDVSLEAVDPSSIEEIEVADGDFEVEFVEDSSSFTILELESISEQILLSVSASSESTGSESTEAIEALLSIDVSSLSNNVSSTLGTGTVSSTEEAVVASISVLSTSAAGDTATLLAATTFEVGHTYSVPFDFLRENSTEESMANQYFGGVAYVRPQSDGTMQVSFTTNSTDYISAISYNGSAVSQSGATFTLSIDHSESDVVITLGLTIVPMQELGMGEVDADMHLYLSQATDLGEDDPGTPPAGDSGTSDDSDSDGSDDATSDDSDDSSSSTIAKTGDYTSMILGMSAAVLAVAGLAFVAWAVYTRKQHNREQCDQS